MTREQFIALISEEQESLRRFLLALCEGDRMEAEDIAQEAMVKAYIAIERFVERAKFATWLFKIAYNTFLDHQRSGWNRRTNLDAAEEMSGGPPANAGEARDEGSIPWLGRSPGGGHGNPLQYSFWRTPCSLVGYSP